MKKVKLNSYLKSTDLVNSSFYRHFLTGHSGTGKTELVAKITQKYKRNLIITSHKILRDQTYVHFKKCTFLTFSEMAGYNVNYFDEFDFIFIDELALSSDFTAISEEFKNFHDNIIDNLDSVKKNIIVATATPDRFDECLTSYIRQPLAMVVPTTCFVKPFQSIGLIREYLFKELLNKKTKTLIYYNNTVDNRDVGELLVKSGKRVFYIESKKDSDVDITGVDFSIYDVVFTTVAHYGLNLKLDGYEDIYSVGSMKKTEIMQLYNRARKKINFTILLNLTATKQAVSRIEKYELDIEKNETTNKMMSRIFSSLPYVDKKKLDVIATICERPLFGYEIVNLLKDKVVSVEINEVVEINKMEKNQKIIKNYFNDINVLNYSKTYRISEENINELKILGIDEIFLEYSKYIYSYSGDYFIKPYYLFDGAVVYNKILPNYKKVTNFANFEIEKNELDYIIDVDDIFNLLDYSTDFLNDVIKNKAFARKKTNAYAIINGSENKKIKLEKLDKIAIDFQNFINNYVDKNREKNNKEYRENFTTAKVKWHYDYVRDNARRVRPLYKNNIRFEREIGSRDLKEYNQFVRFLRDNYNVSDVNKKEFIGGE